MSPRIKSALLLLISVGIGMLLGALLQARLAEQRLERLALLRSEMGLARALERIIEPTDEAQRQAIQGVLESSVQNMAAHMRQNREQSVALLDSTMQALHAVLSDEQIEQLSEQMVRWQERMRMRRDGARRQQPRRRRPPPQP